MPVLLSDEELNALSGITDIQYRLYISGIRRYMDYSTGITGIKRKISYNSLAQEIYVEPKQGNKNGGSRSRDQVKRALKALEKAGLITSHSIVTKDEKQLILKCELAITDNSIQNKPALLPPHSAAPQAAPEINKTETQKKPYKNSSLIDDGQAAAANKSRPASRLTENEKAAPYPISDNKININNCEADYLSIDEQKFINLFYKYKLRISFPKPGHDAVIAAKALVHQGITLADAEEALKIKLESIADTDPGPHSPKYFTQSIIKYKRDLEAIKQQPQEIPDATHKPPQRQISKRKWETLHEQGLRELEESKYRPERK